MSMDISSTSETDRVAILSAFDSVGCIPRSGSASMKTASFALTKEAGPHSTPQKSLRLPFKRIGLAIPFISSLSSRSSLMSEDVPVFEDSHSSETSHKALLIDRSKHLNGSSAASIKKGGNGGAAILPRSTNGRHHHDMTPTSHVLKNHHASGARGRHALMDMNNLVALRKSGEEQLPSERSDGLLPTTTFTLSVRRGMADRHARKATLEALADERLPLSEVMLPPAVEVPHMPAADAAISAVPLISLPKASGSCPILSVSERLSTSDVGNASDISTDYFSPSHVILEELLELEASQDASKCGALSHQDLKSCSVDLTHYLRVTRNLLQYIHEHQQHPVLQPEQRELLTEVHTLHHLFVDGEREVSMLASAKNEPSVDTESHSLFCREPDILPPRMMTRPPKNRFFMESSV